MTALLAVSACFAVAMFGLYTSRSLRRAPTVHEASSPRLNWRHLVVAGFLIRIGAAIAIRTLELSDYFAPDRLTYETGGEALATQWRRETVIGLEAALAPFGGRANFYHYLNGVSYFLGAGPWLILAVNCALGASLVPLVGSLTRRLGGSEAAIRYGMLMGAFFPSLIIWSATNIRDIWALVAIAVALDTALAVRERLSPTRLMWFALAMFVLGLLRGYMFVLVSVGLGISVVASLSLNRVRGFAAAIITAAVCLYLYSATGFGGHWVADASFERLAQIRGGMQAGAESAFMQDADISTAGGALQYLPFGLAYFWFAPFPWIVTSFRQALAVPEMLLVYLLVPSFVRGALFTLRNRFSHAATVISVITIVSIAYALIEGNYGTAYRHRAQILGPALALAAIGLALKRSSEAAAEDRALQPAQR